MIDKEFYTKILEGKVEIGTVVNGEMVFYRRTTWNENEGEWNIVVIPRTDSLEYLGWLFKYAVPKLIEDGYRFSFETALAEEPWYWWIIEKGDDLWKADRPDPVQALKKAIEGVFESEENTNKEKP